jgi:hypothetical protein
MPKNRVRSQQGRSMPSTLIDVRTDDDYKTDPRLIPSSVRRPHADPSAWAGEFIGRSTIVICQKSAKLSEGAAAWLRHAGVSADVLEDCCQGRAAQRKHRCFANAARSLGPEIGCEIINNLCPLLRGDVHAIACHFIHQSVPAVPVQSGCGDNHAQVMTGLAFAGDDLPIWPGRQLRPLGRGCAER